MKDWSTTNLSRLMPYWATVITSLWILAFLYSWTFDKSYEFYDLHMVQPVSSLTDWTFVLHLHELSQTTSM